MDNELIDSNGHSSKKVRAGAGLKKRPSNFWLVVVAGLFIVVPFLTWYLTWFGRSLSDEKIAEYLLDEKNPRHIQHALLQIEDKIERNDSTAKRFYPQIVAASRSQTAEVRKTAAWVMGQDNKSEEFHRALTELLKDSDPLVRRNAALQLVRFGDASGRPEFRAMLQPFNAQSPLTGTIVSLLATGSTIKAGGLLARIRDASGNVQEFRSPVDGAIAATNGVALVKEGDAVTAGQTIALITPDRATVLDALRALAYIGTNEDVSAVEGAAGNAAVDGDIRAAAAQAVQAIKTRSR